MKKKHQISFMIPIYFAVLAIIILGTYCGSNAITTIAETSPLSDRKTVIIDAGHGGVDGGATSCTGILESQLNLEISMRLNDLMHLLGINTQMIRTEDISVYTEGNTIAAKKVSDLKNRVQTVNKTKDAYLISIHQNYYTDSRYSGAQVFFANTDRSFELAQKLQNKLISALNPESNRKCKKSDGIYLMEHVTCPAILVECGFISNAEEEANLRDATYQKQLCCVMGSVVSEFLFHAVA